jgi:hypothetical protein
VYGAAGGEGVTHTDKRRKIHLVHVCGKSTDKYPKLAMAKCGAKPGDAMRPKICLDAWETKARKWCPKCAKAMKFPASDPVPPDLVIVFEDCIARARACGS